MRSTTRFSGEQLRAKALVEMERRVATGVADQVELLQPREAPAFNQELVGKWLEVLWRHHNKDTGELHYIWSTGRVVRIADGLSDARSSTARKILPAGAVLWAWRMRIRTLTSWRQASSGSSCCRRSGTHRPTRRCTVGVTTRVS